MDHEVFHAQRFTRIDGELLCIVHESDKDDNDVTDNGPDKVVRKLGFFLVCLFVCFDPGFTPESLWGLKFCPKGGFGTPHNNWIINFTLLWVPVGYPKQLNIEPTGPHWLPRKGRFFSFCIVR